MAAVITTVPSVPFEPEPAADRTETVDIRVRGTVQGVGFRPTVWRLARDEGLRGEVLNDGMGVLIRATGGSPAIGRLVARLRSEAPPLSRIEQVSVERLEQTRAFDDFRIIESRAGENRTRVTPDAAVCQACRDEIRDSAERRHGYPFANCTHCGPRFSIVREVPYDRANTTMADFALCGACIAEYSDPADRRFHAQPIACPTCGPRVWLEGDAPGMPDRSVAPSATLSAAADLLKSGAVLALRGIGGFHLACDATDAAAVGRLRQRKRRHGKPFAVMAGDLAAVRRFCRVSDTEAALLQSPEAPIVLLRADGPETLPRGIAPGLDRVGFMLPYTPLHLLLLEAFGGPLVMTSGNRSQQPQLTGLDEARAGLKDICDAFLMHDREIANRIDDSVLRVSAGRPRLIRRARGYAPGAMPLPAGFERTPDLLAFGGELKSTFCLLKDGAAILSQHQGDLEDEATYEDYRKNLDLYARMYCHRPAVLAADRHPEYLSTKLARQQSDAQGVSIVEVQHHHAHIASCMVEHGIALDAEPVLGIALDGLGLGDDGTIWGGEFLLADYRGYRRAGLLKPVAMPGGAQAVREPWRNTYAHLCAAIGWDRFCERFGSLDLRGYLAGKPLQTIDRMQESGINSPLASSCGRLFDAVAAALGFCPDQVLFEGQGAMELEAAAATAPTGGPPYRFTIEARSSDGLLCLDPASMWEGLLRDLGRGVPRNQMAARFHAGLAAGIRDMVAAIRRGLPGRATTTVVLSGGCLQNTLLLEALAHRLAQDGLTCLLHAEVPANDGGLALGQAAIAAAHHIGRPATGGDSDEMRRSIGSEPCA